jgi:chloramphenicol 3-O phosphotransferase
MKRGKIILLNGTSSSGKSTLAKGLQRVLSEPFLHFQLDAFIEMLPRTDDSEIFRTMVRGMNQSVVAMSNEGNNLIVDHVLINSDWLLQLLEVLHENDVLFVGIDCPLEELDRREKMRDAGRQGFARQQFENIHKDKIYDVSINTFELKPDECVQKVLDFYQNRKPTAFKKLRIENE